MSKIDSNDLILFQRNELNQERKDLIENELKSNKKLQNELEVLRKADMAMEDHFMNFQMPKDFQKEVKKKFKKELNFFSFLNPQLILSYSGGIATACFMFVFVYTIDPFFQLQGQRNNETLVRGSVNKNLNIKQMPQNWIVNKNFNFQMVKFVKANDQGLFIKNNTTLFEGDKVLLRLIPSKNLKVSFIIKNETSSTVIKDNFLLEKGREIYLPESIQSSKKTFEVEGPAGKESFLVKDKNGKLLFRFDYKIK